MIYHENPVVAHGVFFVPALQNEVCRAGPEGAILQDQKRDIKISVHGRMAQGGVMRAPPEVGEWLKATSRIPFVL